MSDNKYTTIVFEQPAKAIKGNPFHVESEFGAPVTIATGNQLEVCDDFQDALSEIENLGGAAGKIAAEVLRKHGW